MLYAIFPSQELTRPSIECFPSIATVTSVVTLNRNRVPQRLTPIPMSMVRRRRTVNAVLSHTVPDCNCFHLRYRLHDSARKSMKLRAKKSSAFADSPASQKWFAHSMAWARKVLQNGQQRYFCKF